MAPSPPISARTNRSVYAKMADEVIALRKENEVLKVRNAALQELLDRHLSSSLRTVMAAACQTDCSFGEMVDAAVGDDRSSCDQSSQTASIQEEPKWERVRGGRRSRRPAGRRLSVGSSAPRGITVENRFDVLASNDVQQIDNSQEVHLVGDSIVRGVRVGRPGQAATWCYPGTRVEHLTTRIGAVLSKASPKPVVVVHAGTNNMQMDSPRGLAERLRHLVRKIRDVRPEAGVVISAILPRFDGGLPGYSLRQFGHEISLVCRDEHVTFANATWELLRDPRKYFLRDGLHLSAEGKLVLSSVLSKAVLSMEQGN
jgi:hypothetical protein